MSFLLHVLNANRCSTPVATVFPIPCLCSDFRPVLEGHSDIVFAVHCDEIHQAAPQPGIELLNEILIPKLLDEAVHLTAPGLAILDGFTGLVVLRLRRFIPADQFVVIPVIIIVLWHFPFIRFRFFGQEVDGEPLLQQGIALVFLIRQDALYRPRIPAFLFRRGFQPSGRQLPGNGAEGIPVLPIRPFVIAQKMPVGNTHLAVSEPLPMAPGDVFRNAPAFFLCQAAHDDEEEFPFTANFDTK